MRHEHHRQATFLFKPAHNRADFNLVLEIEKRGRLIQQEDLGRLRQGPGNHAALAFTARKIHHRTTSQVSEIRRLHSLFGNQHILSAFPAESCTPLRAMIMRIPAHQNRFHHRIGKDLRALLRHKGHSPCYLNLRHRAKIAPEQGHITRTRSQDFRQQLE